MIARSSSLVTDRSPPRIQMTALSRYLLPTNRPYWRAVPGVKIDLPDAQ
jgi:hypothetical protein